MRKTVFSAGLLVCLALPAQAAEIRVLAPGLVGLGIVTLADNWSKETGNTVKFPAPIATVGKIQNLVQSGEPYDVVLLPNAEMTGTPARMKPGTTRPVGRVVFGLAVKAGAPHPDISTAEKFRAALAGKTVTYNDPASGSLAGKMVDAFFKQPAYADVKARPHKNPAADAVAAGESDFAVAVVGEIEPVAGVEVAGPVPDGAGLTLDVSGAVLANSAHAAEAASFLVYITRPQTAPVWGSGIALGGH